jgi:hypothetical protein
VNGSTQAGAPESVPAPPKADWRKRFERAWWRLWPLLFAIHLFPVRSTRIRELLLLTLLSLWIGGTAIFWKRAWVRVAGAGVGIALLLLALLPGATAAPDVLRTEYLRSLKSYETTYYVWGGETATGIDCSGLLRVAMVDALLRTGLRDANPALLRQGIGLWWRDGSAMEMGRGYGGRLEIVTETRSINDLDHGVLRPGDVAITKSGEHAMAYLGAGRWIEADPGPMRVITASSPGDLQWFKVGMRILRWKQLK